MTREEALKHLDTILTVGEQVDALEMAIEALKERPHGEWERNPETRRLITRTCTLCGGRSAVGNFCMWCGAEMILKEGEEK